MSHQRFEIKPPSETKSLDATESMLKDGTRKPERTKNPPNRRNHPDAEKSPISMFLIDRGPICVSMDGTREEAGMDKGANHQNGKEVFGKQKTSDS